MHLPTRSILLRAALVPALLLACDGPNGLDDSVDLTVARTRWANHGSTSYTFTLTRSCECLPSMTGPVIVTVTNGVVEGRHYVNGGMPVASELAAAFLTIDGLFARIEAALDEHADRIDVSYHRTLGFPIRIAIDGDTMVADDEQIYVVSNLSLR